jgi:hypothetical protein
MSEQNDADEITELTSRILAMKQSNPEAYNEFIGEVKQLQKRYIQMALYGLQDFEGGFKPTRKRNKTKRRRSVSRH